METGFLKTQEMDRYSDMLNANMAINHPLLYGAWEREKTAGICVLDTIQRGVFDIRWIYTRPYQRRRGVATQMIEDLVKWADRNGFRLTVCGKEDRVLRHILVQKNFDCERSFLYEYRMDWKDFVSSLEPLTQKLVPEEGHSAISLRGLSARQVKEILTARDCPVDVRYLQQNMDLLKEADMDISSAYVLNGHIKGLLLFADRGERNMELTWLWNDTGDVINNALMMVNSIQAAQESPLGVKTVRFVTVTDSVQRFAQTYFAGAERIEHEMIDAMHR